MTCLEEVPVPPPLKWSEKVENLVFCFFYFLTKEQPIKQKNTCNGVMKFQRAKLPTINHAANFFGY